MNSSESHAPTLEMPVGRKDAHKTSLLMPVLLLFVVAALAFRIIHSRATPKHDPLHGNTEEAPAALSDKLARLPQSARLPLLLKYVQDPSHGLRYAAVDALGTVSSPAAADAIEQAFHDSDSETRKRAMEVLWQVDETRGLRLLLIGLRDTDPWIREDAVLLLNTKLEHKPTFVDRRAVPTLVVTLDDPDEDVSFSAMRALHKLVAKPWYTQRLAPKLQRQAAVDHWKQWWAGTKPTWNIPPDFADLQPCVQTRTDPCPDFILNRMDGKELSLQSQKGRTTLLNFWNTVCGPCIAEVPDFIEVDRRYRAQNVDVIGIGVGEDSEQTVQLWCKRRGITFPQALATPEVLRTFGDIEDVPVTILIDGNGRIRNVWQGGPRGPEVYCEAIERLLKEKAG